MCDNILFSKHVKRIRKHFLPQISNGTFSAMNYSLPSNVQHRAHAEALMLVMVHRLYFNTNNNE